MRIAMFLVAAAWTIGVLGAEPGPSKGLPERPDYFPIAVWLQDTANAARYRDVGINLYVGLWRGPTEAQLDALDAAEIRLIVGQSPTSLKFLERATIVGWMHDDEPDNAQSLGAGKGYGPPVSTDAIVARYREMKEADPGRPVLLNLGQGVAWDGWFGRGTRTNHPEDYPKYVQGCDIASFDIYPACHDTPEVAGKLWYVPYGVERLRKWSGERPVWACIETTGINNVTRKATPAEIRAEVWMALIRGARGIIYFAHQFKPTFIEAGLLADADVAREVAAINGRVRELAPVLNAPDAPGLVRIEADDPSAIATLVKRVDGVTYVFAASLRDEGRTVTFRLADPVGAKVEVLDESRTLEAAGGWVDRFEGYQVHLYRVLPNP